MYTHALYVYTYTFLCIPTIIYLPELFHLTPPLKIIYAHLP